MESLMMAGRKHEAFMASLAVAAHLDMREETSSGGRV